MYSAGTRSLLSPFPSPSRLTRPAGGDPRIEAPPRPGEGGDPLVEQLPRPRLARPGAGGDPRVEAPRLAEVLPRPVVDRGGLGVGDGDLPRLTRPDPRVEPRLGGGGGPVVVLRFEGMAMLTLHWLRQN